MQHVGISHVSTCLPIQSYQTVNAQASRKDIMYGKCILCPIHTTDGNAIQEIHHEMKIPERDVSM